MKLNFNSSLLEEGPREVIEIIIPLNPPSKGGSYCFADTTIIVLNIIKSVYSRDAKCFIPTT